MSVGGAGARRGVRHPETNGCREMSPKGIGVALVDCKGLARLGLASAASSDPRPAPSLGAPRMKVVFVATQFDGQKVSLQDK
jgi:hypothetical protein